MEYMKKEDLAFIEDKDETVKQCFDFEKESMPNGDTWQRRKYICGPMFYIDDKEYLIALEWLSGILYLHEYINGTHKNGQLYLFAKDIYSDILEGKDISIDTPMTKGIR